MVRKFIIARTLDELRSVLAEHQAESWRPLGEPVFSEGELIGHSYYRLVVEREAPDLQGVYYFPSTQKKTG